ncbi:putative DNA repair glycosylase MJ1434 [Gammaproteobacteria bacterium]
MTEYQSLKESTKLTPKNGLRQIHDVLFAAYGPQHWWPGETPFEVMVGAVLTQNTTWSNVERVIRALVEAKYLDPDVISAADPAILGVLLRPSGYFNVKARRLQNFCRWYLARGKEECLLTLPTQELRHELLTVKGVGPETADDILLYAFNRPVFVIDAYTRRLVTRLGFARGNEPYETLRALFEEELGPNVALYNEYHALIVHHAKNFCRKQRPNCVNCVLAVHCPKLLDGINQLTK